MSAVQCAMPRFLRLVGFAALALVLACFFLWLLFPRDFVRDVPERALNRIAPAWQWRVAEWGILTDWPVTVRLKGVEASAGEKPLLLVDSLELRPLWWALLTRQDVQGRFMARLAGGEVAGSLQNGAVTLDINNLDLAAQPWLSGRSGLLGRELKGLLSAHLSCPLAAGACAGLQGRVHLVDGELPLRNPVLGHERVPFSRISARISARDSLLDAQTPQSRNLGIAAGRLESPLGNGDFAGTLTLARPLATSRVLVQGRWLAGADFFQHVREQPEYQSLRLQAGVTPLAVTLSGSLADPALAFSPVAPIAPVSPAQPETPPLPHNAEAQP